MAATEQRLRDEHDLEAQERAQQQEIARWGQLSKEQQTAERSIRERSGIERAGGALSTSQAEGNV